MSPTPAAVTAIATACVLLAACAVAFAGLAYRVRIWLGGARAEIDLVSGLLALPKRYLVDVHAVVHREPEASRMHVLAAAGLLATLASIGAGAVVAVVLGDVPWPVTLLALASSLVMTAGGLSARLRRRRLRTRLRSLSRGWWHHFGLALGSGGAAVALSSLLVLLDRRLGAEAVFALNAVALMGGVPALVFIAAAGWGGPLKHAFAGVVHLVAHPRPERFESGRSTGLRRPPEAHRFGAGTPSDIPWNYLAGTDACVECGRCEQACPSFAAGMPLNPKALIQDMVRVSGLPAMPYRGSSYPNLPGAPPAAGGPSAPIRAGIAPETLWACTTCRACVESCPMFIEHVDLVVDGRRHIAMTAGDLPGKGSAVLRDYRETDEPGGRDLRRRFDWAFDLGLRVLREGERADVLLWAGDAGFAPRSQRTLRALVRLMRRAGLDVAILGEEERDCGDLARRLGDEITFERLARANVETLSRRGIGRIVTADPHALHCLRNEYPAFGGHHAVVHHTALLLELADDGRIAPAPAAARSVTYHDPCYLARYNGETEPARDLLRRLGVTVTEMERSGLGSRCCGAGGGVSVTDIPGERRIADMRMADAVETGAQAVVVACPNCLAMLEGANALPVEDIAELVERAVVGAAA